MEQTGAAMGTIGLIWSVAAMSKLVPVASSEMRLAERRPGSRPKMSATRSSENSPDDKSMHAAHIADRLLPFNAGARFGHSTKQQVGHRRPSPSPLPPFPA